MLFLIILVTTAASRRISITDNANSTTSQVLNSMGRLMGDKNYDPDTLKNIHQMLNNYNLTDFAENSWQGFINYANNKSDPWGKQNGTGYIEYNPETMDLDNITVDEPCNFASNMAYYRTALQIQATKQHFFAGDDVITALIQANAALAFGSSFLHATGIRGRSSVENGLDNLPIAMIALIAHQSSIHSLESDILSDLSVQHATNKTAIEITQQYISLIQSNDVHEWKNKYDQYIVPYLGDYKKTFAGIVCSVLNLLFPADLVDMIVKQVAAAMLTPEEQVYIEQVYNPLFRNLTAEIKLDFTEKFTLGLKGVGTLLKMANAFLWQEEIIKWSGLKSPEKNRIGGEAMPYINMISNALSGYPHPDKDIQRCTNVYPGGEACRLGTSPHAKWHEGAGNGLLDLIFLSDDVNRLISSKLKKNKHLKIGKSKLTGSTTSWLSWWANMWLGEEKVEL